MQASVVKRHTRRVFERSTLGALYVPIDKIKEQRDESERNGGSEEERGKKGMLCVYAELQGD